MKWQRSSPELIARFDACLPSGTGVERRQMFGYPCAFVNGNMFCGLHEQRLIVRLAESERAALLDNGGAQPFTVGGKTMREYVAFGAPLALPERELKDWMSRALDYARTLPAKVKRTAARGSKTAVAAGSAAGASRSTRSRLK